MRSEGCLCVCWSVCYHSNVCFSGPYRLLRENACFVYLLVLSLCGGILKSSCMSDKKGMGMLLEYEYTLGIGWYSKSLVIVWHNVSPCHASLCVCPSGT